MLWKVPDRSDVKKINKVVENVNVKQLELNVFMLIRDIAAAHEGDYLKGGVMMEEGSTYDPISSFCTTNSVDFIKELITPDVTESRFVSTETLNFIRDVYSMDGAPLKSFHDLAKKYGKHFDHEHISTLLDLKETLTIKNDLVYLSYFIYYGTDDYCGYDLNYIINYDDNKADGNRPKEIGEDISIRDALDIIARKNNNNDGYETDKEWYISSSEKSMLLFFIEREFSVLDGNSFELIKDESKYVDQSLNKILNCDLDELIQYINSKYNIDFNPTNEMIEYYNQFKEYYNHCMMLKKKNDLLYEKHKLSGNNDIDFIYGDEVVNNKNDTILLYLCNKCNKLVSDSLYGNKYGNRGFKN